MKRLQPEKPGSPDYRQIWRVVDGAVISALTAHPEYLAPGVKIRSVRNSIVKRVVGAIHGYAEESAWVRSGSSPADATARACMGLPPGGGTSASGTAGMLASRAGGRAPHPPADPEQSGG